MGQKIKSIGLNTEVILMKNAVLRTALKKFLKAP
jgi:hypothetical protein